MIQNRIRRKVSVRIWDVPMNQSAFNDVLSHTWDKHSLSHNFSFKCEISSCTKRYTNLQSLRRLVKSKDCCFFEQHMKYFNTQQATADEADLSVNNQIFKKQMTFNKIIFLRHEGKIFKKDSMGQTLMSLVLIILT